MGYIAGIAMKENVLAIISILAFIMSSLTWIFTLIYQRRNLQIRIVHYYPISKFHFFLVSIENLSRIPILISQIYLINGEGVKIECRVEAKKVYEISRTVSGVKQNLEIIKNIPMPIQLSSLGGLSGYIAFEDHQGIFQALTTDANFVVHTNRGRSFQLKLPLNRILDSRQLL